MACQQMYGFSILASGLVSFLFDASIIKELCSNAAQLLEK